MTTMEPSTSRRHALVSWLIWTAGFVSFPIAGVAAGLIVGRVDDPLAALVAGLVTGAVIGAGQWLASRGRLSPVRWIPATVVGMGVGLLLGATAVGFGTTLADLAVMGALTGLVLGVAQTLALPSRTRYRWVWAVAVTLLWALGWTVTTLVGVAVEEQFSVFGAAGAVTFSALSGVLLNVLLPARASTASGRRQPGRRHTEGHRMTSAPRHVIFGTGAIGLATLDALLRRGETVRMVNRSGTARVPDDVEVVGGNAADPQFTIDVTRGAQVVYQTMNPPYERWVEEFPALQAGVLAAAEAHGARLVSMENVYMYGRPAGRPLTETRDYAAHTKKGKLRGRMATELLDAHRAGRVAVAIGRASDYFGPRGGAQSNLGDRLFPAALAGKTATVLGDPDQPHTYTYIPDIGEGLAVLGEHPDAAGQVWHLPNDPNTRTTRQLVDLVFQQAGQPRTRLRQIKPWMVRIAALTNRTLRELPEMQYQFEEPFIVDSSKITNTLGVHATPVEQALADTLATYRTAASGTHPKSGHRVAVGTMTAIVHTDYGTVPEDVLRLEEVDKPAMADDQVLVRVRAASVDRGTWHIMAGLPYPIRVAGFGLRKPKYLNPGRSLAGTVEAVGNDVTGFDPGDDVFGICDGSFAEYVCVRTDKLAPKPTNLSFDEAAAVPISGLTALQAVRDHGAGRGRSDGADRRCLGRSGQLRRADRQGVRSRRHRCVQHREGRSGASPRRRPRHRLQPRGFRRRPAPLRRDPRHRRQPPAVPPAACPHP